MTTYIGKNLLERLLLCAALVFAASVAFGQDNFYLGAGQVTLNTPISGVVIPPASYQVSFPAGSFSSTPAVFILPDDNNSDPQTLRIHSVTTFGFEVFVSESDGEENLDYPAIDFEYLAIEPGSYTLGSANIEVGLETGVTEFQGREAAGTASLRAVSFGAAYASPPAMIADIQTLNSDTTLLSGAGSTFSRATEPFMDVSLQNIGTGSFDVALERSETSLGTISGFGETVAWMAITNGTDTSFLDDDGLTGIDLKAFYSDDTITGNCTAVTLASGAVTDFGAGDPIYFGNRSSREGGDGGWLRRCSDNTASVTVQVEEDLADDTEQNHTTETASFVAYSEEFQTTVADPDSPAVNMVLGSDSIPLARLASAAALAPFNVVFSTEFGGNFVSAPVVIPMATSEGNGDPAYVRVWNISSAGFTIAQVVPEGTADPADSMTVDYMLAVPGTHVLPDSTVIEAGTLSLTNCIGNNTSCSGAYSSETFANSFTAPTVIAAPQTINNDPGFDPLTPADPFISASVVSATGAGFSLAFDFSETSQGSPLASPETAGWIAIESGASTTLRAGQNSTTATNHLIELRSIVSSANIEGWDDSAACYSNSFPTSFSLTSTPLVVASKNSRNGNNGGWLRRCAVSASATTMVIDEDQNTDAERSHAGNEQISAFAFSDSFAWSPGVYSHTKDSVVEFDPVNASNFKAIPGSWVRYTVTVENLSRVGMDDGTVLITDTLPVNAELFVGDLDGAGCPIEFSAGAGADSSGLAFTCATDLRLLSGSPPGGCAPDAEGFCPLSDFSFGDDWDSTITAIRLAPQNELAGSTGANSPQFTFDFRVRIN